MSNTSGRDSFHQGDSGQTLAPGREIHGSSVLFQDVASATAPSLADAMTFTWFWDALRRFKVSVVAVSVLLVLLIIPLIWTLLVPSYVASALVSVSPRVPRIVFKTDENGVVPLYKSYQNTQVSTILSPSVLERVLDRADVQNTRWYKDGKSDMFRSQLPAMQRLRESLTVKPIPETELITINMAAVDPADAQLIANAVVDQYLGLVNESFDKTDRTRYQALTEELREIQADIDSALATNHAASKSLGTSEPEELRSQMTTQLSALESELRALQRQRSLLEWERDQMVERGEAQSPDAVDTEIAEMRYGGNVEWRQLRALADAAKHRFGQAKGKYGEAHPKLKDMEADWTYAEHEVDDLQALLDHQMLATSTDGNNMTLASGGHSKEAIDSQLLRIRKNEELLQQQIGGQRAEVNRAGELAQQLAMSNERIARKRELYDAIQSRLQELDVERNAPARISIASYAIKPAIPSSDRRILFSLMAVAASLCTGVGLAVARHRLDPSMRRADEVANAVRIPFLGQLPRIENEQALRDGTDESLHESLRMIRTALLERVPCETNCAILITSPTPETGKTTLTALLGRSLAQFGKKVLIIDADLRRPALAGRLGYSTDEGLTALLHGSAPVSRLIRTTSQKNLDLLAAGRPMSEDDPELLASGQLKKQLEELRAKYDFILLDSPPVLSVADARILAGLVDGALLVLKASHSRRDEATEALLRLTGTGCRLLGTVLVAAEPYPTYYGYTGSYGYSRRPKAELALANV